MEKGSPRNLTEILQRRATVAPVAPALLVEGQTWTFAELFRVATVVAERTARATNRPRVGLLLPTSADFIALLFAVEAAGKTAVPLNGLLPPADLAFQLEDAELDLVLTAGGASPPPGTGAAFVDGRTWVAEALAAGVAATTEPPGTSADPEETACLLYTSGTSGRPKGVLLSHRNLTFDASASVAAAGINDTHRTLNCLPGFHAFPLTAAVLAPVVAGAAAAPLSRFEPEAALRTMRKFSCNMSVMVPSMYRLLVRAQERSKEPPPPLRLAISGGEALPRATAERFERVFGLPLLEGYGQTETSPVVALNTPEQSRPGSVGRPLPGLEVTICDPETNRSLPVGEEGEVLVRGPAVMKGYHRRPEETAAAFTADGRLLTGDLGRCDGDGFLFLTGRRSEMIKVGGEKVHPAEVEAVLQRHPAVFEVGVRGAADERRGEAVEAFVVLKPDAGEVGTDELTAYCRGNLAPYQVPRKVHLRERLPKGATGKILRRVLR